MSIPNLPAGHSWAIEKIEYQRERTMLIIWLHPEGHHVANLAVNPRWRWLGFWRCYLQGLARLRRDRAAFQRRTVERRRFKEAEAAIAARLNVPTSEKEA